MSTPNQTTDRAASARKADTTASHPVSARTRARRRSAISGVASPKSPAGRTPPPAGAAFAPPAASPTPGFPITAPDPRLWERFKLAVRSLSPGWWERVGNELMLIPGRESARDIGAALAALHDALRPLNLDVPFELDLVITHAFWHTTRQLSAEVVHYSALSIRSWLLSAAVETTAERTGDQKLVTGRQSSVPSHGGK